MYVVGGHELGIEEQGLGRVLDEANRGEQQRQCDHGVEARAEHARRELEPGHEPEQQRERDVEEHDLLEGLLEVGRVHGLDAVHDDVEGQQPRHPRPQAGVLCRRLVLRCGMGHVRGHSLGDSVAKKKPTRERHNVLTKWSADVPGQRRGLPAP